MMRKEVLAPGEHFHIYNRGVRGEPIFLERADQIRFLFLLLYCQLPLPLTDNAYHANLFEKHGSFYLHAKREQVNAALQKRRVELVNFSLMTNHFHLTVKAVEDGGVSKYMQRALNAYTKYFNIKHKKEGHLFQGPFQAVHVKGNEQLLHLSAYIHRNPRDIREWRNKEDRYPFSSYPDYAGENRWGELLKSGVVLDQFESPQSYKKFVDTSTAKAIEGKLEKEHLKDD